MANSAPVEIWEKILKYSIAVPLFFSSDPIVEYGFECLPRYCFEAEYWDSERTRNNCRQVCRSWDAFLQPYDHRYVRLWDIYFGRIPLEVIPMAIRLNLSPEESLRHNMRILPEFHHRSALVGSYLTPTGEDRELVKEWRMEILEGYSFGQSKSCLEQAPRLRAVLANASVTAWPKAVGLRFLYTDLIRADASSGPLVLKYLTTLYLTSNPGVSFADVSFKDWRLPSLQHFSIDEPFEDGDVFVFGDIMLEIARAIGKNLVTLHFQGVIVDGPTPNIWPHIPHVERIQLPYWDGTSISAGHPARIVTVSILDLDRLIRAGRGNPQWTSSTVCLTRSNSPLTVSL